MENYKKIPINMENYKEISILCKITKKYQYYVKLQRNIIIM